MPTVIKFGGKKNDALKNQRIEVCPSQRGGRLLEVGEKAMKILLKMVPRVGIEPTRCHHH